MNYIDRRGDTGSPDWVKGLFYPGMYVPKNMQFIFSRIPTWTENDSFWRNNFVVWKPYIYSGL